MEKVSPSLMTGGRVIPSGPGHSPVPTLENPRAQCSKTARRLPHLALPALGTVTLLFSWTPGQPVSRLSLLLSCRPVWRPPVVDRWGSWGGPTAEGWGGQPSPCLCSFRPGDRGWATRWRAVGKRKRGRPLPAGSSHGAAPLAGEPGASAASPSANLLFQFPPLSRWQPRRPPRPPAGAPGAGPGRYPASLPARLATRAGNAAFV